MRRVGAGQSCRPGQPVARALPGSTAAGEAGGEQVAAGRRLPVEHLAGAEHAGQRAQHQAVVQRLEAHAAGAC